MCGFVVVISPPGRHEEPSLVAFMAAALDHRGPDGEGSHHADGVVMHHKRLAVIDPAGGHQPMIDAGLALVFNGEIYNYVELRHRLEQLGHVFRTRSDTEVLLRAYREWGESVVDHLEGMYAFVVHDCTTGSTFAARDPFGIKPLYRARIDEQWVYASEIKAILRHPKAPCALDPVACEDYLSLQFVLGTRTMFAGIHKVEPAHCETLARGAREPRTRRYWTPDFETVSGIGMATAAKRVGELIEQSLAHQVRSDVPLGAYLSGGLDSSVVTAHAARAWPGRMQVFTGAFHEGREYDETPFARAVADHVGADMHTVYPSESEFVEMLPSLVYHMDEPAAGPGLFPQFMVSRVARKHVTVCLGGQGGDEIFVGYARYLIGALEEALLGAINDQPVGEHTLTLANVEHCLGTLRTYMPLMRRTWGEGMDAPGYLRYFRIMNRLDAKSPLLAPAAQAALAASEVQDRFAQVFERPARASHLKKMLHFDLMVNLPTLLQVEDRASMAASLESRVPLLDTRIVQTMAAVPDRELLAGGFSKAVLREVASPLLPESVVHRTDKMGFPVPLQQWFRGPAREFVREVLLSQRARQRGLYDPAEIERLIDHEQTFGRSLWGALQVELWHRTFIDRDRLVPDWRPTAEAAYVRHGAEHTGPRLQRRLARSLRDQLPEPTQSSTPASALFLDAGDGATGTI
ncbi:MAG: asparagine synthase (glutamine-hydrolyzing) [Burkholderiaceae bacterium]